jgi:hypothetical protein
MSREVVSKPLAISLLVFGVYAILAFLGVRGLLDDAQNLALVLIGLGSIWLGNKKGGRRRVIPGFQVYPPSSGFMLRFVGWVLLICPFILWLFSALHVLVSGCEVS